MPTYGTSARAAATHGRSSRRSPRTPRRSVEINQSTAKLISGGNFILKGGGWYADLYSSSKPKGGGSPSRRASSGSLFLLGVEVILGVEVVGRRLRLVVEQLEQLVGAQGRLEVARRRLRRNLDDRGGPPGIEVPREARARQRVRVRAREETRQLVDAHAVAAPLEPPALREPGVRGGDGSVARRSVMV